MPIKTKKPKIRKPAVFDTIDIVDIRFKRIDNTWLASVMYYLTTKQGEKENDNYYRSEIIVNTSEINRMEALLAKIVDGII
jgi:hypothetical protein